MSIFGLLLLVLAPIFSTAAPTDTAAAGKPTCYCQDIGHKSW